MRLALPATLFAGLFFFSPASAQTAAPHAVASGAFAPSAVAYAAPRAARTVAPFAARRTGLPSAPQVAALPVARTEVGITSAWPASAADFSDYAAQEIEAGSVGGDLYVRWYAFGAQAQSFAVEVSVDGGPFQAAVLVRASAAGSEYGVRLVGVPRGLCDVRMVEVAAGGSRTASTPVRVRV